MRFFLDENLGKPLADALTHHFREHEFVSAHDQPTRYRSVDDIDLMNLLREDEFDAIITIDKNQMAKAEERDAVRTAALHWIGSPAGTVPGSRGALIMTTTMLGGLPHALDVIAEEARLMLIKIKGVERERTQRLSKTEPL